MKLPLAGLVCVMGMALIGCNRFRNYEEAAYLEVDRRYTVTLSGKRMLMTHDPVSMLLSETYDDQLQVDLPRLSGSIRGEEIPAKPHSYKYTGTIEMSGTKMFVDLYFDNTDRKVRQPLS